MNKYGLLLRSYTYIKYAWLKWLNTIRLVNRNLIRKGLRVLSFVFSFKVSKIAPRTSRSAFIVHDKLKIFNSVCTCYFQNLWLLRDQCISRWTEFEMWKRKLRLKVKLVCWRRECECLFAVVHKPQARVLVGRHLKLLNVKHKSQFYYSDFIFKNEQWHLYPFCKQSYLQNTCGQTFTLRHCVCNTVPLHVEVHTL